MSTMGHGAVVVGGRFCGGGGHRADSYLMAAGFVLAAAGYVEARDLDQRWDV